MREVIQIVKPAYSLKKPRTPKKPRTTFEESGIKPKLGNDIFIFFGLFTGWTSYLRLWDDQKSLERQRLFCQGHLSISLGIHRENRAETRYHRCYQDCSE